MSRFRFLSHPLEPAGFLCILLTLIGILGSFPATSSGQLIKDQHVAVELIAESSAVAPGETVVLALRMIPDATWHTYWVNPGSPGYATKIAWQAPEGFQTGPLRFPLPHRFATAGFNGYGYEEEALLLMEATVPADAAPGSRLEIKGMADWLMCDPGNCIPGKAEIGVAIDILEPGSEPVPGPQAKVVAAAREALPKVVDWPLEVTATEESIELGVDVPEGFALPEGEGFYFYPATPEIVSANGERTVSLDGNRLTLTAPRYEFGGPEALPTTFELLLVAESGDFGDAALGKALALSTDGQFPLLGSLGAETPAASVAQPGASVDSAPDGDVADAASDEEAAGEGWGYWLQRPMVVMGLIALLLGLSLNLFGVMELGVGLTGVGGKLTQSSGLAGSFFSGALATVLATPCTAPFMGSAIAYALGQPAVVTLTVFTTLALGMAFPYVLLSFFPGLVQRLPRPGPWMDTFKQAMGFPMLAVIVWLLWVLAYQVTPTGLLYQFAAMLVLGLGCWWFGRFALPGRGPAVRAVARIAAVVLIAVSLGLSFKGSKEKAPSTDRDVAAQIAEIQEEGKGVLVDFTAAWCLTCQANKTALHAENVEAAMAANDIAFLEVDWTQRDPAVLAFMQQRGSAGVPLYLLFSADPDENPAKLPNLLTSQILVDAIEQGAAAAEPKKALTLLPALIGAFLGGLILNLMPCVFPVISLKIMGFVSQAGEDRAKIRLHGLVFGAGVLVFFWILAVSLLALRSGIAA